MAENNETISLGLDFGSGNVKLVCGALHGIKPDVDMGYSNGDFAFGAESIDIFLKNGQSVEIFNNIKSILSLGKDKDFKIKALFEYLYYPFFVLPIKGFSFDSFLTQCLEHKKLYFNFNMGLKNDEMDIVCEVFKQCLRTYCIENKIDKSWDDKKRGENKKELLRLIDEAESTIYLEGSGAFVMGVQAEAYKENFFVLDSGASTSYLYNKKEGIIQTNEGGKADTVRIMKVLDKTRAVLNIEPKHIIEIFSENKELKEVVQDNTFDQKKIEEIKSRQKNDTFQFYDENSIENEPTNFLQKEIFTEGMLDFLSLLPNGFTKKDFDNARDILLNELQRRQEASEKMEIIKDDKKMCLEYYTTIGSLIYILESIEFEDFSKDEIRQNIQRTKEEYQLAYNMMATVYSSQKTAEFYKQNETDILPFKSPKNLSITECKLNHITNTYLAYKPNLAQISYDDDRKPFVAAPILKTCNVQNYNFMAIANNNPRYYLTLKMNTIINEGDEVALAGSTNAHTENIKDCTNKIYNSKLKKDLRQECTKEKKYISISESNAQGLAAIDTLKITEKGKTSLLKENMSFDIRGQVREFIAKVDKTGTITGIYRCRDKLPTKKELEHENATLKYVTSQETFGTTSFATSGIANNLFDIDFEQRRLRIYNELIATRDIIEYIKELNQEDIVQKEAIIRSYLRTANFQDCQNDPSILNNIMDKLKTGNELEKENILLDLNIQLVHLNQCVDFHADFIKKIKEKIVELCNGKYKTQYEKFCKESGYSSPLTLEQTISISSLLLNASKYDFKELVDEILPILEIGNLNYLNQCEKNVILVKDIPNQEVLYEKIIKNVKRTDKERKVNSFQLHIATPAENDKGFKDP